MINNTKDTILISHIQQDIDYLIYLGSGGDDIYTRDYDMLHQLESLTYLKYRCDECNFTGALIRESFSVPSIADSVPNTYGRLMYDGIAYWGHR